MNYKSVFIAYLGNAFNDTRVANLTRSFKEDGLGVEVVSFDWTTPNFKTIKGETSVYRLKKAGSSLKYYSKYISILVKRLWNSKADVFCAEDVYTLPFVYMVAKLKRKRSFYNSRELYPFVAGLRNKKYIQAVIRCIERYFIKKVSLVTTTGKMDSNFIEQYYKLTYTIVLRNLPTFRRATEPVDYRKKLNIPEDHLILLYQGVILEGRGIDVIIKTLKDLPKCSFVVLGDGFMKDNFIKLSQEEGVEDRVHFMGTISQDKLINYTAGADVGLSVIENLSLSYYYALPNKLFEYLMAGLPVVCSDMPQMKDIVDSHNVGFAVNLEEKGKLVEKIKVLQDNPKLVEEFKANALKASEDLNWEKEYEKVKPQLFR